MRLRRPQGRWWRAVVLGATFATMLLFTWWTIRMVDRPVSSLRVAAAVAILVPLLAADEVHRNLIARLDGRRRRLMEGAVAAGSILLLVAYAALLGALWPFSGAILGCALGYVLRGRRSRRRPSRYDDDFPLWGDRSAPELDEDGRRWRTGTP